jgi:hypothetical protein
MANHRNLARIDRRESDGFGVRNPALARLLRQQAESDTGVLKLGGELFFARQHAHNGHVLANEGDVELAVAHYYLGLQIAKECWGVNVADVLAKFAPGTGPDYNSIMGDAREDLNALAADLGYTFEEAAELLTAAVVRKATSRSAKAPPRLDWMETPKPRGKIADVLAAFIGEKFPDELAAGTMTTQKLYRFAGLHRAFYNHKDKLPRDLQDMPTRSELNDRMVAEGKVRPEPPRSEYYTQRSRVQRARQRRMG